MSDAVLRFPRIPVPGEVRSAGVPAEWTTAYSDDTRFASMSELLADAGVQPPARREATATPDVVVLGVGHSGTSTVALSLHALGWRIRRNRLEFMGEDERLVEVRHSAIAAVAE